MTIKKIIFISYMRFVLFSSALLAGQITNAEVVNKAADGFTIEISMAANASAQQAYQQFIRVNEWWDGSHSWFGNAENFTIDPKAGGCFCEILGQAQVEHMRVSFVSPNKQIRMLGGLGPLQEMGASGAMTWTFTPIDESTSQITQKYVVSGYSALGLDALAPIVDLVQTGQQQRLIDQINKSQD